MNEITREQLFERVLAAPAPKGVTVPERLNTLNSFRCLELINLKRLAEQRFDVVGGNPMTFSDALQACCGVRAR